MRRSTVLVAPCQLAAVEDIIPTMTCPSSSGYGCGQQQQDSGVPPLTAAAAVNAASPLRSTAGGCCCTLSPLTLCCSRRNHLPPLLLLLLLLLLLSSPSLLPQLAVASVNPLLAKDGLPWVVANRGASGVLPENTLEAFKRALTDGADYLLCNLLITADNELICLHDANLLKTTNVAAWRQLQGMRQQLVVDGVDMDGFFSFNFTLEQIKWIGAERRFTWRDSALHGILKIPALSELLDLTSQFQKNSSRPVGVILDLRLPSFHRSIGLPLEPPLLSILSHYNLLPPTSNASLSSSSPSPSSSVPPFPVALASFDAECLRFLSQQTLLPTIQMLRYGWNVVPSKASPPPSSNSSLQQHLLQMASYAAAVAVEKTVLLPQDPRSRHLLPPSPDETPFVQVAHEAGLAVIPWTFANEHNFMAVDFEMDPYKELNAFISEQGVDGVITDFPHTAVAFLSHKDCAEGAAVRTLLRHHDVSDLFLLMFFVVLAVMPMVAATLYAVYKWRQTEQYVAWQELLQRQPLGAVTETETEPLADDAASPMAYRSAREKASLRRSQVRKTTQAMEIEWL